SSWKGCSTAASTSPSAWTPTARRSPFCCSAWKSRCRPNSPGRSPLCRRSRSMLALLGLLTVVALLAAIIGKKMSPLVALIALPVVAALAGGFGLDTGKFIVRGIRDVAPVAGMFVFAILYFGIMTDAGLLDPVIDRILRAVGTHPRRVVVGTALLALVVHLDG